MEGSPNDFQANQRLIEQVEDLYNRLDAEYHAFLMRLMGIDEPPEAA